MPVMPAWARTSRERLMVTRLRAGRWRMLLRGWRLAAALAVLIAASLPARAERLGAYDYPFVDPILATVVATPTAFQPPNLPNLEETRLLERRWIRPFPARPVPPVFWYEYPGVEVGFARQNGPAPLVVVVAGTARVDAEGVDARSDRPYWAKYSAAAEQFGLTEAMEQYSTRIRIDIEKVWGTPQG